ncbi:hypothetical protein FR483_n070L [Paramecium bursaria Chlorella virus FR483]|uniref:Uncharacterized protein n070L n=1 Tax=Paramecium bursaria Chlorella virus FR483 TaxID=399781 RepID=A7J6C4_PBCVF|nr:hypothetical protein FR483_n070L [Paramecium bursaria Chlorella virus FR483]ABT15355.1 hypothetical protein FR483_n070L [Paramecium bursaria Chlorella virus FR483]
MFNSPMIAFPRTTNEFAKMLEASTFPAENTFPDMFTFCVPNRRILLNKLPIPVKVLATIFPVMFT